MNDRLPAILKRFNPKLDWMTASRYAKILWAEADQGRYPTVRKVMAEVLRWKP